MQKLVKEKLETQVADPTTLQKELETGMQQIEQQVRILTHHSSVNNLNGTF